MLKLASAFSISWLSHFCLPTSLYIKGLYLCKLGWISIQVDSDKADYSHYLVWIAESFNTNVLQHFRQRIMTTSITYSTANDYYMHYLQRNRKTCKLRTDNRKLRSHDYLTNEFQQVIPSSLFHGAPTAPQTKKRRAFSVILTYRSKSETAYQVMTESADNRCSHPPIPHSPMPHTPIGQSNKNDENCCWQTLHALVYYVENKSC